MGFIFVSIAACKQISCTFLPLKLLYEALLRETGYLFSLFSTLLCLLVLLFFEFVSVVEEPTPFWYFDYCTPFSICLEFFFFKKKNALTEKYFKVYLTLFKLPIPRQSTSKLSIATIYPSNYQNNHSVPPNFLK
jgi:hypothetical protein